MMYENTLSLVKRFVIENEALIHDTSFEDIIILYLLNPVDSTNTEQMPLLRRYTHFIKQVHTIEKKEKIRLSSLSNIQRQIVDTIHTIIINNVDFDLNKHISEKLTILKEHVTVGSVLEITQQILDKYVEYELTLDRYTNIKNRLLELEKIFKVAIQLKKMYNLITLEDSSSIQDFYENLYKLSSDTLKVVTDYSELSKKEKELTQIISFSDDTIIEKIKQSFESLSPENSLPLGFPRLDNLLNGGLQKQRIYTFIGLPGSGKSTFLLNAAINGWIYLSNNYVSGPKPVVLYLTLENSIEETLVRMAKNISNNPMINDNIMSLSEIINNISSKCDIIVRYDKPRTISPLEILTFVKEIENKGEKKVELIVIDYLGKLGYNITESYKNSESWERLGYTTDDLKYLAVSADTRILTAHQFNREAIDKGKTAGHGNVGGSWKIVENSDVMIYSYRRSKDKVEEGPNPYQIMDMVIRKNRFGPDNVGITVIIDFNTWKIREFDRENEYEVKRIQNKKKEGDGI